MEFATAPSGAQREKLNALPYDLVPFKEMTDAYVRVAEFGAKKYAPWNWSKGLSRVQLIGSLLRHTFAYLRGEERDGDSGLLHTDHILWNAVALAHNVHHNLEDGRRVEPPRDYTTKNTDLDRWRDGSTAPMDGTFFIGRWAQYSPTHITIARYHNRRFALDSGEDVGDETPTDWKPLAPTVKST